MDILHHEIIGFKIEVVDALNTSLIGLCGRVINETKDTLTIKNSEEKILIKNQITFKIKKENKVYKIKGSMLKKRPEERTKLR